MAEAPEKPAGRPPMRTKHKVILIVTGLLMMGVLRTGFMFLIIGIMPSIVAYYMDVSAERYTFKTIFACNLTGMLPYIAKLLEHGPSSAVLQSVMGDANSWIIIYGSAIMGWLLIKICPMLAQFLVLGVSHTQISTIEHVQKKIEGEWGQEVTQFSTSGMSPDEEY